MTDNSNDKSSYPTADRTKDELKAKSSLVKKMRKPFEEYENNREVGTNNEQETGENQKTSKVISKGKRLSGNIVKSEKSVHSDTRKNLIDPDIIEAGIVVKKRKPETHEHLVQPAIKNSIEISSAGTVPEGFSGVLKIPSWPGENYMESKHNNETMIATSESGPTIKINIGHIEVRAVMQQTSSPLQPQESLKPKLSLDDYLSQRNHNKK
jgi:hypothetical protein